METQFRSLQITECNLGENDNDVFFRYLAVSSDIKTKEQIDDFFELCRKYQTAARPIKHILIVPPVLPTMPPEGFTVDCRGDVSVEFVIRLAAFIKTDLLHLEMISILGREISKVGAKAILQCGSLSLKTAAFANCNIEDEDTIDNCVLARLPPNLEQLVVESNRLKFVPPSLAKQLKEFRSTNNQWIFPPREIFCGPDEQHKNSLPKIRRFFDRIENEGKTKIAMGRILVLGASGAGKTSLVRALGSATNTSTPIDPGDRSTGKTSLYLESLESSSQGIISQIMGWIMPFWRHGSKGGSQPQQGAFRIDIQDVPGHNDANHVLFTHRTMTLLVVDLSLEDFDSQIADICDQWLDAIHEKCPDSTVMLVGTHIDCSIQTPSQKTLPPHSSEHGAELRRRRAVLGNRVAMSIMERCCSQYKKVAPLKIVGFPGISDADYTDAAISKNLQSNPNYYGQHVQCVASHTDPKSIAALGERTLEVLSRMASVAIDAPRSMAEVYHFIVDLQQQENLKQKEGSESASSRRLAYRAEDLYLQFIEKMSKLPRATSIRDQADFISILEFWGDCGLVYECDGNI